MDRSDKSDTCIFHMFLHSFQSVRSVFPFSFPQHDSMLGLDRDDRWGAGDLLQNGGENPFFEVYCKEERNAKKERVPATFDSVLGSGTRLEHEGIELRREICRHLFYISTITNIYIYTVYIRILRAMASTSNGLQPRLLRSALPKVGFLLATGHY